MIRFLRPIRQRLLNEGRTTKYLRYALGEIVLVVIGILIALQLNTWNDSRKNRVHLQRYTANLIEDLQNDSIKVAYNIEQIQRDSAVLSTYETRISTAAAAFDTIRKIARYEYEFRIHVMLDFNTDTYEVLSATGDIGLFDKEIISDLNTLFNLHQLALTATNQTFESYRHNIHRYAQKYPVKFQSNLISHDTPIAEQVWNNISLQDHAMEFNSLVLAKGDSYRLALRHLPQVAKQTNALLAKLRNASYSH